MCTALSVAKLKQYAPSSNTDERNRRVFTQLGLYCANLRVLIRFFRKVLLDLEFQSLSGLFKFIFLVGIDFLCLFHGKLIVEALKLSVSRLPDAKTHIFSSILPLGRNADLQVVLSVGPF